MEIIDDWIRGLQQALSSEPIAVRDLRIGVFYTAVELSTGQVGVAFTPRELVAPSRPRRRPMPADSPGNRRGRLPGTRLPKRRSKGQSASRR